MGPEEARVAIHNLALQACTEKRHMSLTLSWIKMAEKGTPILCLGGESKIFENLTNYHPTKLFNISESCSPLLKQDSDKDKDRVN